MHDISDDNRPLPPPASVPASRAARLLRLGGMASGVLGGMLVEGAREMARGTRPSLPDLLLTPATASRLTRDLGRMRGAAMKLGQLISMDSGLILPPEMSQTLAALQSQARHMPPAQLRDVLNREWGAGWQRRFARFDVRPFAAASIGQVHRAQTRDGCDLAIKVQYPGVRASIDSDIDNLGLMLRIAGAARQGIDLAPMLKAARDQLHQEADYAAEARNLGAFGALLAGSDRFTLPGLHEDLCTPSVLAMDYLHSQPLDALTTAPQALRDRVAADLIDLVLRELFDFRLMQTDPNLANYRFDPETGRICLLDFGAVMPIRAEMAQDFRALLGTALDRDNSAARDLMGRIGYFADRTPPAHRDLIVKLFDTAMEPLRQAEPFDFGRADLIERLRAMGRPLGNERELTHVPPPETLFLHRKIGGIYLTATRLRARVALRPLLEGYRG